MAHISASVFPYYITNPLKVCSFARFFWRVGRVFALARVSKKLTVRSCPSRCLSPCAKCDTPLGIPLLWAPVRSRGPNATAAVVQLAGPLVSIIARRCRAARCVATSAVRWGGLPGFWAWACRPALSKWERLLRAHPVQWARAAGRDSSREPGSVVPWPVPGVSHLRRQVSATTGRPRRGRGARRLPEPSQRRRDPGRRRRPI